MKTFYSLIKLAPNEMSSDTLTIGIILSSVNGYKLKFSENKIKLIRPLISIEPSIIDFLIKEFKSTVDTENKKNKLNNSTLFELPALFSSEYFIYLSNYSNGLLKFTAPNIIADLVDDKSFEKLYQLFVDNSPLESAKISKSTKQYEKVFYEKVDLNLISIVKDKVHTNQSISHKIVPSLLNPFEIDCIGLNGVLIGAKSVPFTQSKETLHKSLNTYVSVIAHFSSRYNKHLNDNKFFLIADQPDKKSPVFNFWEELYKNDKLLTVISSDDSGQVAELIDSKNAKRFID